MQASNYKKKIAFVLRGFISIAIIVYLISIPDWRILFNLNHESYYIIVGSILLTLIVLIFMSLRWQLLLLSQAKVTMPYIIAYRGYLKGLFYNIFMPGAIGGDLYRIKYSKDYNGISIKSASIVVGTERLFGALALITLFITGISIVGTDVLLKDVEINHIYLLVICLTLIIVSLPFILKKINLDFANASKLFLLSLVAQGIDLTAASFILHIIMPNAEYYWILIAMPLAFFATVLPISIGGIGVREGVLVSVFVLFGATIHDAIVVSILIYLVKVIAGTIGMLYLQIFSNQAKDSQVTTGIRSILSIPFLYQAFQNFVGKNKRHIFFNEYAKIQPGEIVLDVGCGTGNAIEYMPEGAKYIGIDLSEKYIKQATKKYGSLGLFICDDITNVDFSIYGTPDIILSRGVLHHLNDSEVKQLFTNILTVMGTNTRIVTVDPCYDKSQNFLAKFIISMDRGQHIRTRKAYSELACASFGHIKSHLRHDLLRMPYTHCIIQSETIS